MSAVAGLAAVALPAGALLAAPFAGSPAQAATRPSTASEPSCSWGAPIGAQARNVLWPDSGATYWAMRYRVHPGLRIVVSGTFPDSRYASLSAYRGVGGTFTTNGVSSSLTDYQMTPDPGSVNPWQHAAPAGGGFTLTMRQDAAPGDVNTLPLAPAGTGDGTLGYLVYRVYLPAGGPAAVRLPEITFEQNGVSTKVRPCAGLSAAIPSVTAPGTGLAGRLVTGGGQDIRFARRTLNVGILPNDATGYLVATITPPDAKHVVVIRGKAPAVPGGDHPSVWPAPGADLRYWSLCTNLNALARPVVVNRLPGGGVDPGCRHDDETALDSSGYYTFVLGTEAQRATIEKVPGVTFVPFSQASPRAPEVVLLRNMLAADSFAQAVQRVPANGNPDTAASIMGAYYPKDAVCPLTTVTTSGAAACTGLR